jgi:hypothetical protein
VEENPNQVQSAFRAFEVQFHESGNYKNSNSEL